MMTQGERFECLITFNFGPNSTAYFKQAAPGEVKAQQRNDIDESDGFERDHRLEFFLDVFRAYQSLMKIPTTVMV